MKYCSDRRALDVSDDGKATCAGCGARVRVLVGARSTVRRATVTDVYRIVEMHRPKGGA